jgi:hypothetical protein
MPLTDRLKELLIQVRVEFDLDVFIEGGTYYGSTALWASDHFDKVVTVELSPALHEIAKAKINRQNILFLQGDTREVFKSISPSLVCRAIFWLDSHWSGGETAGEDSECPLLDELSILLDHDCIQLMLIDDARLFLAPPPPPHKEDHWPNIASIVQAVYKKNASLFLFIVDDVIIVGQDAFRPFIINWLRNFSKTSSKPDLSRNILRRMLSRLLSGAL